MSKLNLAFSADRWQRVEQEWTRFWAGEQARPMVNIQFEDPAVPPTPGWRNYFPQYGKGMSLDEIISLESAQLSRFRWAGDSFPSRMVNFGTASMAAYMGARLEVREETVWFHPSEANLEDLSPVPDKESEWYRRTQEILAGLTQAWGKDVQIIHSDMEGGLDILAALRGANDLLMDLCDDPERIAHLARSLTRVWLENYDLEGETIRGRCRGTANWGRMFSKGTTFMHQCDFSYMISPTHFEAFVLPELISVSEHLSDPFYHLDGIGALVHLDTLLRVKKLKGVQWIPGAGQRPANEWADVLTRIRQAGKFCQIYTTAAGALLVKKEMGGRGFVFNITDISNEGDAEALFQELTRPG